MGRLMRRHWIPALLCEEVAIGTTDPSIRHVDIASIQGIVPKSTDWRRLTGTSARTEAAARAAS